MMSKVLSKKESKLFLDIKLHTGRQHQIRVQMANIGCPLIGDTKYGSMKRNETKAETNLSNNVKKNTIIPNEKSAGFALCSYRLEFVHPITGEKMDYKITPQGDVFSI